jgi:hypothetical protein
MVKVGRKKVSFTDVFTNLLHFLLFYGKQMVGSHLERKTRLSRMHDRLVASTPSMRLYYDQVVAQLLDVLATVINMYGARQY